MSTLRGHGLRAEGAAFTESGERKWFTTIGGFGFAFCSCGLRSGHEYRSAEERKRWHRAHKDEVRLERAREPHPEEEPGQIILSRAEGLTEMSMLTAEAIVADRRIRAVMTRRGAFTNLYIQDLGVVAKDD